MILGKANKKEKKAEVITLKKEEGFTLIEVLVAVFIFAVGLLGVAAMQISAIKVNSTAGQITTRSTWAQDKFEELIALAYSDPWLEAAGNPPGTDSDGNTHQETTSDGYSISWIVIDDSPVSNTKLITVTVSGRGKRTQLVGVRSQSL